MGALQRMKQQQIDTVVHFESKLSACQETQRQLEVENALIRDRLEKLCMHLGKVLVHMQPTQEQFAVGEEETSLVHTPLATSPPLGVPSSMPAAPSWAGIPQTDPTVGSVYERDVLFHTPPPRRVGVPVGLTPTPTNLMRTSACDVSDAKIGLDVCNFMSTAPHSPVSPVGTDVGSPTLGHKSPGGDGKRRYSRATPKMRAIDEIPVFVLTLRRDEAVPLGLEWKDDGCLVVAAVSPGSTVEAWNRQCAGDARVIRSGDRIVDVNGATEADAMRLECSQKLLLKMTIERGEIDCAAPTGEGPCVMRADAQEFVPGVSSSLD